MHVSNTSYTIDLQKQKSFLRLSSDYWELGLVRALLHIFGSMQSAFIDCTSTIIFDVDG